jgi:peptidoglycan/LPS O-acetylase OafA/YrhL
VHEAATRRRVRLPYLPGVDGLRALAVIAVVLYHAEVSWLPAGFLGVDVFFTISGFLITSLLLSEHVTTGTIALGDFWARRARRLLPALFFLLAGVSLATVLFAHDAASRLQGDLPAAVFYVSNWWQVLRGGSYFEQIGRPPLLQHLWTLAVEEQFYVVAPLVLGTLLRRGARRARMAVGATALAVASAVWMAIVWSPTATTSRAYFGTDTHAAPLLLGVALGFVWRPSRLAVSISTGARRLLDVAVGGPTTPSHSAAATASAVAPTARRPRRAPRRSRKPSTSGATT